MTALVTPDVRWHASWAASMQEFGEAYPHGSGLGDPAPTYDEAGCAAYVAWLLGAASHPIREDWVRCSFFWITDGDEDAAEVIGFLALRHELNDWLLEEGGHIGYSIRPSRRRQGHASRALALALIEAKGLGLERALVTCDEDNDGSRGTIEANGGVYEDSRNGKRRYWIATS
ncbi:putative acetyltransferase [Nocardioides ginsengisegetis]|uniref:Putative acetyltransferase n=1 Tax=Nocardioides ginsengisegetis TaxID=661491 RepID=A0A7W3IW77_9ACTN|nr:GNAT family N-acetyltransferase [Nocardioides ginsengisegetis]MBA8801770.1 putative acetyltransferase [Nocardioides ginsengisegetis]